MSFFPYTIINSFRRTFGIVKNKKKKNCNRNISEQLIIRDFLFQVLTKILRKESIFMNRENDTIN